MLKLSCYHTSLGVRLQRARQDRQLTQRALARQATVSIPTLRLLEHSQGNLTSLWAVLSTLHLDIRWTQPAPQERVLEHTSSH